MKDLLPRFTFCVFDLETTGLNPRNDSGIIEVGAVRFSGNTEGETFQSLADPGHSIPDEITEITGLSDGDIKDATPAETVVEDFLDFAGDSILIAHNARFDLSFLEHTSPDPIEFDHIDTLRLSRQLLTAESHSLSALAEALELSLDRPHRALEDALATRELFLHLSDKISEPEDYFRCDLPGDLIDAAPVDVPEPVLPGKNKPLNGSFDSLEWILYSLYELDASIGINKLSKILCGSRSQDVEGYRQIESYGRLTDKTQATVQAKIKRTIEDGYIERSGEPYPVLSLTDEGIRRLLARSKSP